MRTLVLGAMPDGATPQTHLASGPWCFAGREERFPGWDGPLTPDGRGGAGTANAALEPDSAVFPMPDDPYPDARSMAAEARAANGEVLRLIRLLGEEADAECGCRRSERYWQMALGPFLLPAVHMLAERQRRVADLIRLHGSEPLRVELLPEDIPFSFRSTLDFTVNGIQNVHFNHYVFSRMVEAALASDKEGRIAWRAEYLPAATLHQATEVSPKGPAGRCADVLRRLLRDLPFPRYKGFSLGQALFLSLAVLGNGKGRADKTLDFSLYGEPGFVWNFPAETLIRACLPLDLRNGLQNRPKGQEKIYSNSGPLRGMTPAFSQDDAYRLRLAELRESGCRLFCVQHGANYGNLLSVGILPFEYGQHAFFTWGWQEHGELPVNARPLPHPILAGICGAHKESAPRLILVGTEMSPYLYRLKSRPLAKALLAYRQGKVRFFRELLERFGPRAENTPSPDASAASALTAAEPAGKEPPGTKPAAPQPAGDKPAAPKLPGKESAAPKPAVPELLYRPYFKTAGGLDDAEYLRRHLPGIGLCAGDLTEQMLGCRLLVLDHYGTTLHTALAADVPTLAFWNRDEWGMDAESERVLDALQQAGILHASPEEAARQAVAVWDDPAAWWQSAPARQARALWLERYAMVGDGPGRPWDKKELTRRWFAAIKKC